MFLVTIVRCRQSLELLGAQQARRRVATSGRARQVTLDHIVPMCFPSLVIHWSHTLIGLPKPCRTWVHIWLAMLSPTVMSIVQVLQLS
jgi:hypothetical protein